MLKTNRKQFAKFTRSIMREKVIKRRPTKGCGITVFDQCGTVRKDVGQRYEEELSLNGVVSSTT